MADKALATHRSREQAKYDMQHMPATVPLSKAEKSIIRYKWGGVITYYSRGYNFFSGIKAISGFNPDYVPSCYFFPYIEGKLNPASHKYLLAHKSLTEKIYGSGISHPVTLVRTYGGLIMDHDYNPITKQEAIDIISRASRPLLYKPSAGSEQGAGIRLIFPDDIKEISSIVSLSGNGCDYVIQELVEQSEDTKIFNPSSLNCFRITTLNLNGRVTVGSIALKCGPEKSVVDNIGSGKRGVIVGVSENGDVSANGFYGNGETAVSHNGVKFDGKKIKNISKVISAAKELHRYVESCKIIGWDIALDSEEKPVLIEGNTVYPGISLEQMCSGPIFQDRTDEVIDFLKSQKKKTSQF